MRRLLLNIAGLALALAVAPLAIGWQVVVAQSLNPLGLNPLAGEPRAILAGGALFRAQCATCHGADGRGIVSIDAPDLTLMWARDGVDDAFVYNVIRDGVPGSIMPPHSLNETELWMLVAFLASQSPSGSDADFTGDAGNGRRLFAAHCAECHRAGAESGGVLGAVLGPGLTGITRRRSPEALLQSIREPSQNIGRGFRTVTVETAAGESVTGLLKNEDAFSLQLVTEAQTLRAFVRSEVRRIDHLSESLMPAFTEADLSPDELADLLAFLHENQ